MVGLLRLGQAEQREGAGGGGGGGGAGGGVGRNQHTSLSLTENSLFSATCLVTFDPCGEAEGSSLRLLALSSSLVV